ncbi:MAG: hypothetical protein WCN95_07830, partial [bacterium]
MTNTREQGATSWYLKTSEGSVYGPVELSELRDWAGQGRVAPGDQLSQDEKQWVQAETIPELGLEWMVEVLDSSAYGPVHISAIRDLVADGAVAIGAKVTNRSTGQVSTVEKILAPDVAPMPDSAGLARGLPVSDPALAEELQKARNECKQLRDQAAKRDAELRQQAEALQRDLEAAKKKVALSEEAAKKEAGLRDQAAKRDAELRQRAEALQRDLEAAKQKAALSEEAAKKEAGLRDQAARRDAELQQRAEALQRDLEAAKQKAALSEEAAKKEAALRDQAAKRDAELRQQAEALQRDLAAAKKNVEEEAARRVEFQARTEQDHAGLEQRLTKSQEDASVAETMRVKAGELHRDLESAKNELAAMVASMEQERAGRVALAKQAEENEKTFQERLTKLREDVTGTGTLLEEEKRAHQHQRELYEAEKTRAERLEGGLKQQIEVIEEKCRTTEAALKKTKAELARQHGVTGEFDWVGLDNPTRLVVDMANERAAILERESIVNAEMLAGARKEIEEQKALYKSFQDVVEQKDRGLNYRIEQYQREAAKAERIMEAALDGRLDPAARKEIAQLEDERQRLVRDLDLRRQEMTDFKNKQSAAHAQLTKESKGRIVSLEKERNDTAELLARATEELTWKRDAYESLAKEREEECNKLLGRMKLVEQERDALTLQVTKLGSELNEQRGRFEALDVKFGVTTKEVGAEVNGLRVQVGSLTGALDKSQKELEQAGRDSMALREEVGRNVQEFTTRIGELEASKQALSAEYHLLLSESSRKEQELNSNTSAMQQKCMATEDLLQRVKAELAQEREVSGRNGELSSIIEQQRVEIGSLAELLEKTKGELGTTTAS